MSDDATAPAELPDDIAAQMAAALAAQKAREEAEAAEAAAREEAEAEAREAAAAAIRAAMAAAQAAAAAKAESDEKAAADALAASLAALQAGNAGAAPIVFPVDEVSAPLNRAGVAHFGPTFAAELRAAGLSDWRFAVSDDRVTFDPAIPAADKAKVTAVVAAHNPDAVPVAIPPDCPSLAFWLTALDLWMRDDGKGGKVARTADVQAAVSKLVAAGNPLGKLAARQLEYANTVLLADLLKLAPAFDFSAADCAESLWRADRVAKGDLTGVWPLPA